MSEKLIESAYEMIGGLTPLKKDCGYLCSGACCESEGYMLLFPGEEKIMNMPGFEGAQRMLQGYGRVYTVSCEGVCQRDKRPLSCRIFPLAPKFVEGELFVRMDPRAKNVCPLSHNSILSLDKNFTNTIKKTFLMLNEDDNMSKFLKAVAEIADGYENILGF